MSVELGCKYTGLTPGSEPFWSDQGRALKEKLSPSPKAKSILIECLHALRFLYYFQFVGLWDPQNHYHHHFLSAYSEPDVMSRDFQFSQFCVMLFCACGIFSNTLYLYLLDASSISYFWQPKISLTIVKYPLVGAKWPLVRTTVLDTLCTLCCIPYNTRRCIRPISQMKTLKLSEVR